MAPLLVEAEISDRGDNQSDAADFDLDGDLDLILEDAFRWLEFVSADPPTFVEHDLVGAHVNAFGIACADMNGDNRPDIVASFGNGANLINWYENVPGSPPSFQAHPLYSEPGWLPWELDAVDLDGDGDQDVVSWNNQVMQGTLERLVWHENLGNGASFASHVIYEIDDFSSFLPINFEVADLDGDDDLDFFIADTSVRWLENDGSSEPSWQVHDIDVDFLAASVRVGDFDRDGDLDGIAGYGLALLSEESGLFELRLYENVDGNFSQVQVHSLDSSGLFTPALIDLNADGRLDIFQGTGSSTVSGLHWLENLGNLTFAQHVALNVDAHVPQLEALATDLVSGDGQIELIGPRVTDGGIDGATVLVEARMRLGGWATGMTIDRVRCRNLSTGQSASTSTPAGASFDCEQMGLDVNPGDRIQLLVRGRVE